jgi:hypothetical protein
MLEKISWNQVRESESYKKGKELYNKGANSHSAKLIWVKKEVTETECAELLKIGAYCPLTRTGDKRVVIGFAVGEQVSPECKEVTDPEDLRKMDAYFRSITSLPYPLEEVKIGAEKAQADPYPEM